jgi:DNA-binding SARP family transcriptional activator
VPKILTDCLRIFLLGAHRVEWGGHTLAIKRRNVRGLLYRLAIDFEFIPRPNLCLLFWPDVPEAVARRNLSHLLTHLRLALPDRTMLLTTEDMIGLDAQRGWCDVVEFRRLTQGNQKEKEDLRQAVDLYRASFLAGFSLPNSTEFENWASLERSSLENMFLITLKFLIKRALTEHNYEQAISDAIRYLETDDLAEEMYRKLIVLYATVGNRTAALRVYERCVAVLERELGVSPLPNTRAFYQMVLHGQIPDITESVEADEIKSPRTSAPDLPLVGRASAWWNLENGLNRARSGLGSVIFITGEAGIGKSRLMQDFMTRFRSEACILFGAGYPGGQTIPYLPLVEALRSMKGGLSLISELQPIWLVEVSRLLPELRGQFPDLPVPATSDLEDARIRLFDALNRYILSIASAFQVTVLCMDDLQWVDQTTLDWLIYFCRQIRLKKCPVLIVASYRDDEAGPITEWCQMIRRLGIVSEIELRGLDELAIGDLVRQAFTHLTLNEHQIRRLKHATGGNPLFLKELLIELAESGLSGDFEGLPLPKGLAEAITERLRQLDAATRQVLEAAAVLGSISSLDGVYLTAGRSEMESMESLERLCAHHIMFEGKEGYRFAHDLFRQAVESGLSPVRRQLLHRRAGRSLEKLDPAAVGPIAYHFEAGGEYLTALHYHDLATQKARGLFAWQEAVFHQGRMLKLLEQLDPRSVDRSMIHQRGVILAERARLRYFQNQITERDADLSALTDLANSSGDSQLQLLVWTEKVIGLNFSGRNAEAVAAAQKGLVLAESLEDQASRLCFLAQLGLAHYHMGEPRAALEALEPARTLSEQEHNLEMQGDVSQFLGHVHFHLGNYAKALEFHLESLEYSRRLGDQTGQVWCSLNVGFLYLKLGYWEKSKEWLNQGLALTRQIDMSGAEAFALTLLGQWELYRGNYQAAIDFFLRALPIHQVAHAEPNIAATEEPLGMSYYQLGDLDKSREWLERAERRVRSIGYRRLLATVLVDLGLVEISCSHLEAAYGFLSESIAISRECECRENLAKGLAALSRLERQAGNLDLALNHAQEAIRVAQESVLPICQMWGEIEAGQRFLASGEPARGLECTSKAVSLLPQAHEAWIGTEQVHFVHAWCLRALGQAERAAEHERLAYSIIGAKTEKSASFRELSLMGVDQKMERNFHLPGKL